MLRKGILNKLLVIFFQGLALISLPLIAKYIGSKQYGMWSIIYSMMQMLVPIFILQLDSAFTRFLSSNTCIEKTSNKFISIFLLLSLISIIVWANLPFFDSSISKFMFADIGYTDYVYITCIWIFLRVFINFSRNYFRTFGQFHIDTKISISQQLSVIISIGIITFYNKGLFDFFLLILSFEAILLLIVLRSVYRKLTFNNVKINIPKKYFIYALPLIPTMILSWIINYSDQLMIVHFSTLEENARYSLYYTYSRIPHWVVITPLNYALLPFLSKYDYVGKSVKVVNHYIKESINISFLIISIFIVGLIFFESEILFLLSSEPINSNSLFLILFISLSVFATAFYQIVYHILSLINKMNKLIFIFGAGATINIILNLILIQKYGVLGAAISTLISFIIVGLLTWKATTLLFKDTFYKSTLTFLSTILISAFFIKYYFFDDLIILSILFIVFVLIYILYVYKHAPKFYYFIINRRTK